MKRAVRTWSAADWNDPEASECAGSCCSQRFDGSKHSCAKWRLSPQLSFTVSTTLIGASVRWAKLDLLSLAFRPGCYWNLRSHPAYLILHTRLKSERGAFYRWMWRNEVPYQTSYLLHSLRPTPHHRDSHLNRAPTSCESTACAKVCKYPSVWAWSRSFTYPRHCHCAHYHCICHAHLPSTIAIRPRWVA